MTDTNAAAEKIKEAAERVRRLLNGDQSAYPIASASCDPDSNMAAIVADLRTLADAYLAQQPTYTELAAECERLREETQWIRGKLKLPAEASSSDVYGAMHVLHAHAHGYQTYIAAYKCDDKQGEIARLTVERNSLKEQHAELNAELLDLARRYDPNCDVYVYEDQANAMDAARQTVEAMQELATFLGRDPEGCLVDCADEAMGRIEKAEEQLAALTARDDEKAVDEAECYYVQNVSAGYVGNNPMFWAKGGNGYSSYIDNAELFTAKAALELLQSDTSKWRVWPASLISKCTYRTVESQGLSLQKAMTVTHLLAALGEVRR